MALHLTGQLWIRVSQVLRQRRELALFIQAAAAQCDQLGLVRVACEIPVAIQEKNRRRYERLVGQDETRQCKPVGQHDISGNCPGTGGRSSELSNHLPAECVLRELIEQVIRPLFVVFMYHHGDIRDAFARQIEEFHGLAAPHAPSAAVMEFIPGVVGVLGLLGPLVLPCKYVPEAV